MKKVSLSFICFLFVLTQTVVFAQDKSDAYQPPPIEAFSSLPFIESLKLSPNGEYLAGIIYNGDDIMLQMQKLYSQEKHILFKFSNKQYKLRWFDWANDKSLLMGILFVDQPNSKRVKRTRLLRIDLDGLKVTEINKRLTMDSFIREPETLIRDDIIDLLPDDPDHVLINGYLEVRSFSSVYKLNLYTGNRNCVKIFEPPITKWIADKQGRIKVGIGFKNSNIKIIACESEGNHWRTLWEFKIFKDNIMLPLCIGNDPNILFLRSDHQGKNAIFKVDLRDMSLNRTLVASNSECDIDGELIYSSKHHDVVGINYTMEPGRQFYWNNIYENLQKTIDKALPEKLNTIVSTNRDETKYIVFSTNSVCPGSFYLVDIENRSFIKIANTYPMLNEKNLAGKKRISFTSDDKEIITGYLTIPRGNHEKPYPIIIYINNDNTLGNLLAFDYKTEFFDSRGYALFQMVFKDSTDKLMTSGLKNWRLEIQENIADVTQWLIDQRIADPNRIAILGVSYGGYVAFAGAINKPDSYQCIASFAGVFDWELFLGQKRHSIQDAIIKEGQFGNLIKFPEQPETVIASHYAEKIKIPVFIAHGDDDQIVNIKQSELMAKALKKNKKEFEYLVLEGGDHHLSQQQHRTLFFQRLDAFLAKHLK